MSLTLSLFLACSTPAEPSKASPAVPAAPTTPAAVADPHADHHAEADHEETAAAPTIVPDSYAAIIAELKTRKANLERILAAGSLKEVHPQAQVVMDLAAALPGKATDTSRATVSLKALDLKEKADALHDHADEGDAAGAKQAFDEVSADIDALAAVTQ